MLLNDPRIWGLGETQLLAELESLRLERSRRDEEFLSVCKFVRASMVQMLGLNLMPIEDSETGLLRRPKEHEILPLVGYLASPELLKVIGERTEMLMEQEKIEEEIGSIEDVAKEYTPEELDEYLNEDLLFVEDPKELEKHLVMHDPHTQNLIKQVVKIREDVENPAQVKNPGKSDVIIEAEEVSASPQKGGVVKIDKTE